MAMLGALKCVRMCRPYDFNADNYVDARIYSDLALETDPRNPALKKRKRGKR
jgi:hypothetical protein